MWLIDLIKSWFKKKVPRPSVEDFSCPHEKPVEGITVIVHGITINVPPKFCADCTQKYFETYFRVCSACGGPIHPLTPVAFTIQTIGPISPTCEHPFKHLECADAGAEYSGIWGMNGRLVTLHELRPDQFPPDTNSVLLHCFVYGGSIFIDDIAADIAKAREL